MHECPECEEIYLGLLEAVLAEITELCRCYEALRSFMTGIETATLAGRAPMPEIEFFNGIREICMRVRVQTHNQ